MFKITLNYRSVYLYNGDRGYYIFSATEKFLVCGCIEMDSYHKSKRVWWK